MYVPIYDLQGNVACLINAKKRKIVESYRYSCFGEEEITNENGKIVSFSELGNPWRYLGKRIDQETGLVYFGYRYYEPVTGRWISPDPIGTADGPNLYSFAHNNPLSFTDLFGLATEMNGTNNAFSSYFYGEVEPACTCEVHRTCKRGGDIGNGLGGALLGAVRFAVSKARGLVDNYGYMAMEDFLDTFPVDQRESIRAFSEDKMGKNTREC